MFCEHCGKPAKFAFTATMRYDARMHGTLTDIDGGKTQCEDEK